MYSLGHREDWPGIQSVTSPVKKVAEARLGFLSLAGAKQEHSDVARLHAATTLATTHATYNKDESATIKHLSTATMEFLEYSGLMREQEKT